MYQSAVISIKVQSQDCFTRHTIHIKFNIIISSHTKQPISVHHIKHLPEQNFLFKLEDSLNLVLFVYMIDFSIFIIIIQNKTDQTISIRHN